MLQLKQSPYRNAKILIVDDRIDNLDLLSTICNLHGFKTSISNQGKLAIKLAKKIRPNVILLDINMPEMDGRELSEFIRYNPSTTHIPIIMVTSEASDSAHMTNIQQTGVNALCDKPFESDEVRGILVSLLDKAKVDLKVAVKE